MKSIIRTSLLASIVFAMTSIGVMAQSGAADQPTAITDGYGVPLKDQTISRKLSADLNSRNSTINNSPISWFDLGAGNGYYGTYNINDNAYMTRYDQSGTFVNTYTRTDWNSAAVPASVKNSYSQSQYAGQTVTGYWSSPTDNSSSFLEVQDKKGNKSRVWVDKSGQFVTPAPAVVPK